VAERGTERAIALLGGELGRLQLLATGIPPGVNGGIYLLRVNLESTGVLHSGYSRNLLGFYTPDILGVYAVFYTPDILEIY